MGVDPEYVPPHLGFFPYLELYVRVGVLHLECPGTLVEGIITNVNPNRESGLLRGGVSPFFHAVTLLQGLQAANRLLPQVRELLGLLVLFLQDDPTPLPVS